MKTTKQIRTRSYYFAELVSDYFTAFKFYPTYSEMRVLFLYASRKANFA